MKTVYFAQIIAIICLSAAQLSFAEPKVRLVPLSDIALYPERSAPAEVVSLNTPVISSQINAQIIEIPVKVGDIVKKGDILARLDCRDYEYGAQSASARRQSSDARLKLANQRFERTKKLVSQRLASDEDLDARQSDLDAARGDLTGARMDEAIANLGKDRCVVVAPSNGLVLERMASEGQLAATGTALAHLMDLDDIEISAQVYSEDANDIGPDAEILLRANERIYPVKIRTTLSSINPSTRNREVRLDFLDKSALPGTSGKIFWRDNRPHLPPQYLVRRNSEYGFFVAENGRAKFVPLPNAQPGRSNPLEGINTDTLVIADGFLQLEDNAAISSAE